MALKVLAVPGVFGSCDLGVLGFMRFGCLAFTVLAGPGVFGFCGLDGRWVHVIRLVDP